MKPAHTETFETNAIDAATKQTVHFKTTVYYDRIKPFPPKDMRTLLEQWALHSASLKKDSMANVRGGINDARDGGTAFFIYAVGWAFVTSSRFAADKVWDAVRFKKRLPFLRATN